jgi:hypothetical protein
MADRGPDRESIRNVGDRSPHGQAGSTPTGSQHEERRQGVPGGPADAGKTSGAGSPGHDRVDDQGRVRNEGRERERGRRTHETPDPLPELEP